MARSRRREWISTLAIGLGCAFLVATTAAVVLASRSDQTEELLARTNEAHRTYTEVHEALSELNERVQEWVLLAGDPAEELRLEGALAWAGRALLAFSQATPPSMRAEVPDPTELDRIVTRTRLALPSMRTEADLEQQTHTVDAQVDQIIQRCDVLDLKRIADFEQRLETLRAERLRQSRRWFVGGIFALLATLLLLMRQLREIGREEGAERERVAIVERISDGFTALDLQWRYVYVNAAAERLLGRKREQLIGRLVWEVFPGKEHEDTGEAYRRAMETQKPETYETFWEEGGVWFETRLHPSPEGLAVYFRDITEERRMRERLAASEARFRQIVETAQEGIWTFGPDGRTTFVNHKLTELLGYSADEMIGQPLFAFMDAEGQRIAASNLQRRAIGLKDASDFKLRRKSGEELWVLMATSPLENGEHGGVLAMLTDISERREAEAERTRLAARERNFRAEAEASLQRFRVLADLVPNIVWSIGGDGFTEWSNRAFEAYTGLPADQVEGLGWQAIFHPNDLAEYVERWRSCFLTGEPFEARARLRRVDGSFVWHTCRAHPLRSADGRIVRWFGVATADHAVSLVGSVPVGSTERLRL